MANVQYETSRFSATNSWGISNGTSIISISLDQLIRAAITVGHPDWSTVAGANGLTAIAEMFWKASSTVMTLGETGASRYYAATDRFISLDPSEKRGATYQMGLTVTKAFADILFNAPWLMHLDVYGRRHGIRLGPSSVRPDLFGLDAAGNWIVFECKGLSNPPQGSSKVSAKAQARRVTTIGSGPPAATISSFAYFERDNTTDDRLLKVYLEDPDSIELSGATEAILIQEYYRPLLFLFDDIQPGLDQSIATRRFRDLDLKVSIDAKLLGLLRGKRYRGIRSWLARQQRRRMASVKLAPPQPLDGFSVQVGPSWIERVAKRGFLANENVDE